ncbi:MAG TPA: maleylpyruvate isomerase family mycothiol-dependent enzyme [Thermomonospora sp.]|nr:maleylpyruvate isomerase family mycothiol-dependent enzyme [Thermomonospora sp.]
MSVHDYPVASIPWPRALTWAREELDHYLEAASDPALQPLPTRCPPWTVHDLTAHLACSFERFADMLGKSRAGDLEPPFPPHHLAAENLRAVAAFTGDPLQALREQAGRFLDAVDDPVEPMAHQLGPIPAGLQVMFGLNELAVHHDDLAQAAGRSRRPPEEIVTALAAMYGAVFGLPDGLDLWTRLLQATGRPG